MHWPVFYHTLNYGSLGNVEKMLKKGINIVFCLMLVSTLLPLVSAVETEDDGVESCDYGFLCRLRFNGKTGACFIRHFEFNRPVDCGIKWGFMQFSDAEIEFGRYTYSGDGIIFLSHFLGKTAYNEQNEHWTFDGIARGCFVKEL